MPYEDGMNIEHDADSKQVVVTFRGHQIILARKYDSPQEGKAAGEYYCRQIGWDGN
jgi:hypothetical protein